jgi:hypothetical protein
MSVVFEEGTKSPRKKQSRRYAPCVRCPGDGKSGGKAKRLFSAGGPARVGQDLVCVVDHRTEFGARDALVVELAVLPVTESVHLRDDQAEHVAHVWRRGLGWMTPGATTRAAPRQSVRAADQGITSIRIRAHPKYRVPSIFAAG